MLLSSFLMAVTYVAANAFVQVSLTPDLVQTKDATLNFGFSLSKSTEVGQWLRVFLPSEMTVSASVMNCKEVDGQLQISSCTANVLENYIQFNLNSAITISGSSSEPYRI